MRRRKYMAAMAALLGLSAGCLQTEETMTEEHARQELTQVQEFKDFGQFDGLARAVDEDAGVVIFAGTIDNSHAGQGMGLSVVPIEQTDLD